MRPKTTSRDLDSTPRLVVFSYRHSVPTLTLSDQVAHKPRALSTAAEIKSYLSSIQFFQILQCGTDQFIRDISRLTSVLQGIKSEGKSKEVKEDNQTHPHLPVTTPPLTRTYHILLKDPTNFKNNKDHSSVIMPSLCSTLPPATTNPTSTPGIGVPPVPVDHKLTTTPSPSSKTQYLLLLLILQEATSSAAQTFLQTEYGELQRILVMM